MTDHFYERTGYNYLLSVDPAGGSSYTDLTNIRDSIEGPDSVREMAPSKLLNQKWETYVPGAGTPGELTFDYVDSPEHTIQQTLMTMLNVGVTNTPPTWQLTHPAVDSGSTKLETFAGYVKSVSRSIKKGDLVVGKATIQITGAPLWAVA